MNDGLVRYDRGALIGMVVARLTLAEAPATHVEASTRHWE